MPKYKISVGINASEHEEVEEVLEFDSQEAANECAHDILEGLLSDIDTWCRAEPIEEIEE